MTPHTTQTKNTPPILRGEQWRKAHPKTTRRGGRPQIHMPIGARYGRLVVIGSAEAKDRRSRSICRCDCGNIVIRKNIELKQGIRSCGCLLNDAHKKHGLIKHGKHPRLYNIWVGMKVRCHNPKSRIFKHYGGRGITICSEWKNDFKSFYDWAMAHGYADNKSIDRINVNGNYEPDNCQFITQLEQCWNRRTTRRIEINGVTKTIRDWCAIYSTPMQLAISRYGEGKRGIDVFLPPYRIKG